jgi:hypothetical protein
MKYTFKSRWKEELVCTCENGILITEITMGTLTVYPPDEAGWERQVPVWAKGDYSNFISQLKSWCLENKIPISIESNGWIYEVPNKSVG